MKNTLVLALVAAAALSACGGGSDSPAPAVPPSGGVTVTQPVIVPTVDAVTAASTATATAAGLTAITANADEETFDVTADIGDTWRITLNSKTGAYSINVLSTQFSLPSQTGTATRVVNGNYVTYTAATVGRFTLVVDSRTKTISGNVTLGGKQTTVAGTGYTVTDLPRLAGTYTFLGTVRAASGAFRQQVAGQVRIDSVGTTGRVCENGIFNASNVCVGIGTSTPSQATLTLAKNANGTLGVKSNGQDFGILNVSAGDRGPVLLLDRFGLAATPSGNVFVLGSIYAAKQARLSGTEFDGNFSCNAQGVEDSTVVVLGTSLRATELPAGTVTNEVVTYNQLVAPGATIAFDGVLTTRVINEPTNNATNILALSTSLAVVRGDQSTLVCRKTN